MLLALTAEHRLSMRPGMFGHGQPGRHTSCLVVPAPAHREPENIDNLWAFRQQTREPMELRIGVPKVSRLRCTPTRHKVGQVSYLRRCRGWLGSLTTLQRAPGAASATSLQRNSFW